MATHEDITVTTNAIESSLFASFQWEIRTRIFVYPGRNSSILKIKFSAPQNSWVSSKMLMSPLRVGVLLKPLSKIKDLNIFQNNLLSERNYGFKYWEIFHFLSLFFQTYIVLWYGACFAQITFFFGSLVFKTWMKVDSRKPCSWTTETFFLLYLPNKCTFSPCN